MIEPVEIAVVALVAAGCLAVGVVLGAWIAKWGINTGSRLVWQATGHTGNPADEPDEAEMEQEALA